MTAPFSERVTTPRWREEVAAWVATALGDLGLRVTQLGEQVRVRPWSTQLRVGTDRGTVWFKALCRWSAHEPAVQAVLAEAVPAHVDAPLALHADLGWMLTGDRGATLASVREATQADWAALVTAAVEVQQAALTGDVEARLRAAGLPWCEPEGVAERVHDTLARTREQQRGRAPQILDEASERKILRLLPRLEDAARTVRDGPFPVTFQHGDLHPGNVFAGAHGPADLRIFDLGDAMWANALTVLCVPMRWAGPAIRPALRRAFEGAWGTRLSDADWARQWEAARLLDAVDRAAVWAGAIAEATDAEWRHWMGLAEETLPRALEPWSAT